MDGRDASEIIELLKEIRDLLKVKRGRPKNADTKTKQKRKKG